MVAVLGVRARAADPREDEKAALEVVKKFVAAQGQEDVAGVAELMDGEGIGERLFAEDWKNLPAAERAELGKKLGTQFRQMLMDYPDAREMRKKSTPGEISPASHYGDEVVAWAPHVVNGVNDRWQVVVRPLGGVWKVVDFGDERGWIVAGKRAGYEQARPRVPVRKWVEDGQAEVELVLERSGVPVVGDSRPEDVDSAAAAQTFLRAVVAGDRAAAQELFDGAGMAAAIYGDGLSIEDRDDRLAAQAKLVDRVMLVLFDMPPTRAVVAKKTLQPAVLRMRQGDASTYEVALTDGDAKKRDAAGHEEFWRISLHRAGDGGWRVMDFGRGASGGAAAEKMEVALGAKNWERLKSTYTAAQCIRLELVTIQQALVEQNKSAGRIQQDPALERDAATEVTRGFVQGALGENPDLVRKLLDGEEMARQVFKGDVSGSPTELEHLADRLGEKVAMDFRSAQWRESMVGQRIVGMEASPSSRRGCRYYVSTWGNKGAMLWTVSLNIYGARWKVVDYALGKTWSTEYLAAGYQKERAALGGEGGVGAPAKWMQIVLERSAKAEAAGGAAGTGGRAMATSAPARQSTKEFKTSSDVMTAYGAMYRAGKGIEAIERFWDLERVLQNAFADDYDQMAVDQKARAKVLMLAYMKALMANPALIERLKQAEFSIVEANELSEGRSVVVTKVEGPEIKGTSRYYLWRTEDGLKVFDVIANGPTLSDALNRAYRRAGAGAEAQGPLKFLEGVAGDAEAAAKRGGEGGGGQRGR